MPSASPGPNLSASLSGCFYARATLILPEQKQIAKSEKEKPVEAHCLSQMHRLLSAASGLQEGRLPPQAAPRSWAGGNCSTHQQPPLSPADPQRPHPRASEVTLDALLLSWALGSVCSSLVLASVCKGLEGGHPGAVELRTAAGSICSHALADSSQLQ